MKLNLLFAIVVAVSSQLSVAGDTVQTYYAHRLPAPPVVDGFLEPTIWEHAAEAAGEFLILGSDQAANRQSSFRMGYTDEALFIGVICKEPQIGLVQATAEDEGALWSEDSVEIFLQPHGLKPVQFIVNAIGSRWSRQPLTWDAAAVKGADYWSIEVRLPWDALGLKSIPAEDSPWLFTICRNIRVRWSPNQNTAWTRMDSSYGETEHYAVLTFSGTIDPDEKVALTISKPIEEVDVEDHEDESLFVYSRHFSGTYLQQTEAEEKRLFFNQGAHIAPRISPSKTKVLFNSTLGGTNGVWMHDLETGEDIRLSDGSQGSWSWDEEKIVLVRNGTVIVRDLESGRETQVSQPGWNDCLFPVFSPAGTVYFVRSNALYHAESSGVIVQAEIKSAPVISPSGKKIAYQDGAHIFVRDLASGITAQHTFAPGVQCCPAWISDGKGLVYLQKSDPLAKSGDVYYQGCGSQTVGLVERDVLEGFDWAGSMPHVFRKTELPGRGMHMWSENGALATGIAEELPEQAVPVTREGKIEAENVCFGNGVGVFHISTQDNKLAYVYGTGGQGGSRVAISVRKSDGADLAKIDQVKVIEASLDLLRLQISLSELESGAEHAILDVRLFGRKPILELTSPTAGIEIVLRSTLDYFVVPDRLSNDLILTAADLVKQDANLVAHHGLVLGLGDAGSSMLVCMLNDSGQDVTLRSDGNNHVEMCIRGQSVSIGGVSHPEKVWMLPEIIAEEASLKANWQHPFLAEWTLTTFSETSRSSCILNEDTLGKIRGKPFEIQGRDLADAGKALVYVRSQSKNTPLDIVTVKDVVLSCKGLDGAFKVMQTCEARCYRTSENRNVPFLELTKPREDALPWQGTGVLDTFAGVTTSQTPALRQFVEHLCGDAVELLRSLDVRIEEYRSFFERLSPDDYPEAVQDFLREQRETVAQDLTGLETIPLDEVAARADKVIEGYSNGWKGFKDMCLEAHTGRQKQIGIYRHAIQRIREVSKRHALFSPAWRTAHQNLDEKTESVLKHRFYLESEWHGESPGQDILWAD